MYVEDEAEGTAGHEQHGWNLPKTEVADRGGRKRRLVSGNSDVMMFADEHKPYSPLPADIEVLASVPLECELPENFTQQNVKYTHFKKRYNQKNYPRRSKWEDQFRRCQIFISDPSSVLAAKKQSAFCKEILEFDGKQNADKYAIEVTALQFLFLDPHVWMHASWLMRGQEVCGAPNMEGFASALTDRFERNGRKLVNVGRVTLRSQALNHELLKYAPYTAMDNGYLSSNQRDLPALELAASINSAIVYDTGYPKDLTQLFEGQHNKELLVKPLSHEFILPEATQGLVRHQPSDGSPLIQLAGIAAGVASDMYRSDRERSELPRRFKGVWVNGDRI
jgi:hypothetical protein